MSNKRETPKDVNSPGMANVQDVFEWALFQGQLQIQDKEKTAEVDVMSGSIPDVLKRILSFLPVSSLKDYRLVNTKWNEEAVPLLQKILPKLHFPPRDNHSFRELMMDNKIPPFVKFSIEPDEMLSHHVERLFNTIAPSATHLQISNDVIGETKFDPVEMYIIPEFPKLKNLYQIVSFYPVKEGIINWEQWMSKNWKIDRMLRSTLFGILEKSPKLQNLAVDFSYRRGQPTSYYKDLLFESLENKNNANLRHLQIREGGLTDSDFARLIALGLRLTSISLLEWDFVDSSLFRLGNQCSLINFLSCQSETLVYLELRGLAGVFDRFQFPLMKNIQTLTINSWKPLNANFEATPSINYNEQLPSLKRLKILSCKKAWVQFLPDASYTPVQAVEDLELNLRNLNTENTEIYVLHMAQCFPNLRVLGDIPISLKNANSIYKWLPRLEDLTFVVRFSQSIDDIITGLSSETCAALRPLPGSEIRKLSVVSNEIDLDDDSPRPLSSLKNLKILRFFQELESENYLKPVEFWRVSTLLVLTNMPSLESIEIIFCDPMFYVELFQDMKDEIQDLKDSGKSILRPVPV